MCNSLNEVDPADEIGLALSQVQYTVLTSRYGECYKMLTGRRLVVITVLIRVYDTDVVTHRLSKS